jgi:hypothetical protein
MRDVLREQQFALARHIRDPERHAPPPRIEARRLRVYRELFFNNIRSLLSSGFPVIRETLGQAQWTSLVQAFFANHRSATPLFPRVASEFVEYLAGRVDDPTLAPWLPELAHYEWVEQQLFTSDASVPAHDVEDDVVDSVLAVSPLAMVLAYRWPVTDIGPGHVPRQAPDEPTTLLVHRDATHEVCFTRIAPLVHRLLSAIGENADSGRAHLAALAAELQADPSEFEAQGATLLATLRDQGVVLATPR